MEQSGPFTVEQVAGVAHLTLNRPEIRNAMDPEFFRRLADRFRSFGADDAVRVIVIKAAGKSFTAGTNLVAAAAMLAGSAADERDALQRAILQLQEGVNAVENCCKPVIAAVHGHCIGGGVDLICACDVRLAERSAVFSIRETRMGIVADLGTLQRLPRIIGEGRCRELALTGRDFTAEEAFAMGLVTRVCDGLEGLRDQADALARQIADNPPLTVQGVKDVMNYSRDHGIAAGLRYAAQKNAALLPSEDLAEAFDALRQRRKPQFKGR